MVRPPVGGLDRFQVQVLSLSLGVVAREGLNLEVAVGFHLDPYGHYVVYAVLHGSEVAIRGPVPTPFVRFVLEAHHITRRPDHAERAIHRDARRWGDVVPRDVLGVRFTPPVVQVWVEEQVMRDAGAAAV